jgi:hypothetical protein
MARTMNVGLPDCEAQSLWDRVADTADRIADTVDEIARLTVCGERTRAELGQAGDLLEQVEAILLRTSEREGLLFTERARLLGDDLDPQLRSGTRHL